MSPPAGMSAVWTMVWVMKKQSATKWALEGSSWAAESGGVVRYGVLVGGPASSLARRVPTSVSWLSTPGSLQVSSIQG